MERFARFYLETGNAAASYLKAGYKPSSRNSLDSAACRLSRSVKVKARIRELQGKMVTRNRITVDSLIEELMTDRDHARRLEQPSVAITATMNAARLVGLLVDRKESGTPGEFAGLQSEAETIAKVRAELGDDAASALAKALAQAERSAVPAEDEVDPMPAIEPTNSGNSTLN